jgi:hypothetical protein
VTLDVEVPDGFTLTGDLRVPSWTAARDGDTVRFTGGRIEPFGCGYVTLRGRAERKGRLVFPVTVTAEDGTTTRYASTDLALPDTAGLLYVGVDPPDPGGDDGEGAPPWTAIGVATAAALGLAAAVVAWPRRKPSGPRRRATRRRPPSRPR